MIYLEGMFKFALLWVYTIINGIAHMSFMPCACQSREPDRLAALV